MKKLLAFLPFLASAAFADPGPVSVATVSQDAETRMVSVSYTLGGSENAIVTASVVYGGKTVELGDKMFGDVNAEVAPGVHAFQWLPLGALANADYASGELVLKLRAWSLRTPPDYMAISISCPEYVRYYTEASLPGGVQDPRYFADTLLLRRIPAKNVRYRKGALTTEWNYAAFGVETEYVTLPRDFYIGVYEFTQRQWQRLTGTNQKSNGGLSSRAYDGKRHGPVHRKDWERHPFCGNSAAEVAAAISAFAVSSGKAFALPSEAEWEFACRAGCGSELYTGKVFSQAACDEISAMYRPMEAYYGPKDQRVNNYAEAMPCGLLVPNAWNLYDMLGNVRELCSDVIDGKSVVKGGDNAWSIETSRAGARELVTFGSYRDGFRMYLPIE